MSNPTTQNKPSNPLTLPITAPFSAILRAIERDGQVTLTSAATQEELAALEASLNLTQSASAKATALASTQDPATEGSSKPNLAKYVYPAKLTENERELLSDVQAAEFVEKVAVKLAEGVDLDDAVQAVWMEEEGGMF